MIQLKSREVVGSNSKLNGCGNVIDVCCDNVFDVREWNAVDAEDCTQMEGVLWEVEKPGVMIA